MEEARLSQQHPQFQPDSPVLQRGGRFNFSTDSLDGAPDILKRGVHGACEAHV